MLGTRARQPQTSVPFCCFKTPSDPKIQSQLPAPAPENLCVGGAAFLGDPSLGWTQMAQVFGDLLQRFPPLAVPRGGGQGWV